MTSAERLKKRSSGRDCASAADGIRISVQLAWMGGKRKRNRMKAATGAARQVHSSLASVSGHEYSLMSTCTTLHPLGVALLGCALELGEVGQAWGHPLQAESNYLQLS
jgi:hypothetical protein